MLHRFKFLTVAVCSTTIAVFALLVPTAALASGLSINQARNAAHWAAYSLPVKGGVNTVRVTFCDQFTYWRYECGIQANGTTTVGTYDPCKTFGPSGCMGGTQYTTEPTSCDDVVSIVKNSRTGLITTRRENELDCDSF